MENGRVIYRASSLGFCIKSLVAVGMGMDGNGHPDWLLRKFQEGIDGEPVVLDMLRSNWRLMDESEGHYLQWHDGQLYVEVDVGTNVTIRGHADGIGTCYMAPVMEHGETDWVTGDKRLVEVKCTTPDYASEVIKRLPMMYKVQVSVYGGFFGLPIMLALGIKDSDGKVVNVCTEMYDEPPMSMGAIKARVMAIEGYVERGELPTCDYRQWPCQYPWLCDEDIDVDMAEWFIERKNRGASADS